MKFELLHIYISRGHNFFGHHDQPAGQFPTEDLSEVHCVAGRGLQGDRFFGYKKNYKGQVTFFADEIYQALCERLQVWDKPASVFRRNLITRGVDLNSLVGVEFEVQGVRFAGTAECSPCHWMDEAFAPGAEAALKGNGGLRAKVLSDGLLKTAVLSRASVQGTTKRPR